LLLSDIPSYRELWDGAACFFRSNDATDLRRRWQELLAHPELRDTLTSAACARAAAHYSAERMAARYRDVYARARVKLAA
jgi:glycosyltransferase involved in cell wall biosynthesis